MILTPPTNYGRHRVPAEEVGLYQEILLLPLARARIFGFPSSLVHASHFAKVPEWICEAIISPYPSLI